MFKKIFARFRFGIGAKNVGLKLRPHSIGSPFTYWRNISLSVAVAFFVTWGLIYCIHALFKVVITGIPWPINNQMHVIFGLLAIAIFFGIWIFKNSKALLEYLRGYQENVLLAMLAFCIGFQERERQADGEVFAKKIQRFAILIAALAIALPVLYFSNCLLPSHNGSLKLSWFSFHISLALLSLTMVGEIALGKSEELKEFSRRIELGSLAPYKDSSKTTYKVIQISDLHVTTDEDKPVAENDQWRVRDSTLQSLAQMISKHPGIPVIVSGDATDTGDPIEWKRFEAGFGVFNDRLILAPGNHDLNIVGYGEGGLWNVTDKWYYEGRIVRLREYFKAAIRLMPGRVYSLTYKDSADLPDLEPLDLAFEKVAKEAGSRQYRELISLFPLVVNFDASGLCAHAIVWNSTRPSALPWWNSLGAIDGGQLQRFEALCKLPESKVFKGSLIHVVHHKVGMPKGLTLHRNNLTDLKHRIQYASMTMQNPWSLVNVARNPNKDTVILHGHHHVRFHASVVAAARPVVDIYSAPSSTLECEGHMDTTSCAVPPGFDVITLGVNDNGTRIITPPSWSSPLVRKGQVK